MLEMIWAIIKTDIDVELCCKKTSEQELLEQSQRNISSDSRSIVYVHQSVFVEGYEKYLGGCVGAA